MFTYQFSKRAIDDLKNLPKNKQQVILNKLEYFLDTNEPLTFAKTLTNYNLGQYRFRVGDFRITFDLGANNIIYILHIAHRREIYR